MKKLKKKKKAEKSSRDIRSFFVATSNVVTEVKSESVKLETETKEREKTKKQTQVAIQVALAKHNPFRRMPPLSPLFNERYCYSRK